MGYEDEVIWQVVKNIYPEARLAQVYWANERRGITWHRDAAFAEPTARILNLGKVTLEEKEHVDGEVKSLTLFGGEIVEFNCKKLHRSTNVDAGRIAIAMWIDRINIEENWL